MKIEKLQCSKSTKWAGLIVLLAFAACAAYYVLTPRVYESTATFSVGIFVEKPGTDRIPIEDPRELRHKLRVKPGVVLATSDSANARMITLRVEAGTSEQARADLKEIVDDIFARHRQIFNTAMEQHQVRLKAARLEVAAVQQEIKLLDKKIAEFPTGDDSLQGALERVERLGLRQQKAILERQVSDAERLLARQNATETELVQPVTVSARPVRPSLFFAFYLPMIILGIGVGVKLLWKLR